MPHFEDAKKAAEEMTQEKHTSCSWNLPTGFDSVPETEHEGIPVFVGDDPFDTIAFVIPRPGCHANAILIAIAPKLLEALKRCIGPEVTQKDIDFGYFILAKATGEHP